MNTRLTFSSASRKYFTLFLFAIASTILLIVLALFTFIGPGSTTAFIGPGFASPGFIGPGSTTAFIGPGFAGPGFIGPGASPDGFIAVD